MRIAVLTLRLHTNYGGLLQAYALMTVLKRLGHEPVLIFHQPFQYRKGFFKCEEYLHYVQNAFRKFLLGEKQLEIFREKRIRREYETIYRNARFFIDKYIQPHSDLVCSNKELQALQDTCHFDAYVVGSDQVWRPAYAKPIIRFFLSFVKDCPVKRISYAASFGVDSWTLTQKETSQCRALLARFDAISVREESGVDLCRTYLGRDAVHLLDPTMLLSPDDYRQLIPNTSRNGTLFSYILDPTAWKTDLQKKLTATLALQLFDVQGTVTDIVAMSDRAKDRTAPVEAWLNGFATAKYVITDSFHACVFSILFHVPFWVCENEQRGNSRIRSLLKMFHLEERLIQSESDVASVLQTPAIDWNHVDCVLEAWRQKSLCFLKDHLE